MKQTYDELDTLGNIVVSNIKLVPGLSLPEGHKWVEHVQPISVVKHLRNEYIANQRDLVCYSNILHLNYLWQADKRSQELLSTSIMLAMAGVKPSPLIWRTVDNIGVEVTIDNLKSLAGVIASRTEQAYIHSWILKAKVAAAVSEEEINLIVWV